VAAARSVGATAARYAAPAVLLLAATYALLAASTALGLGLLAAEVLRVTASYPAQRRTVSTRRARSRPAPALRPERATAG
jgi:hypothetical protein